MDAHTIAARLSDCPSWLLDDDGKGIVASANESVFALDDPSAHRLRSGLERVLRWRNRIDDLQPCYVVLASLDELLELARIDLAPFCARVPPMSDIAPDTIVAGDEVITCGTGAYQAARTRGPASSASA